MAPRVLRAAITQLARRGYVVRRHPAVRRQAMFSAYGVDLVFDVGAASGAYGSELRDFGYRGRLVSFEPLTSAYARLVRASADDAAWSTHQCALGRSAGTATINVASNSDSSSLLSLGAEHRRAAPQVDYVSTEEVQVARLDDVAPDHLDSATAPFLKMDTQGFEGEVLAGGAETLARCVGVQLELSFVPLYEGGVLVDEMLGSLYDQGFRMVGLDTGFASPSGQILQADGVFFRPERALSR